MDFEVESNMEIETPTYIVNGLIPQKAENLILGVAGSGKSLLIEQLLTCIKYNKDFLGLKTIKNIDSLLIDEDTPTQGLTNQFRKLSNAITDKPTTSNNIYVKSMSYRSITDDSLLTLIKDNLEKHPNIKLIVFDCLHKICRGLNVNDTVDMNKFTSFKQKLLTYNPDLTIIITHHISQKKNLSYDELMTKNPDGFSMSSSVIMQDVDSVIVIAAKTVTKGKLLELGIRPIAKRFLLNTGNFTVKFTQNNNNMQFTYDAPYIKTQPEINKNIMKLFKNKSVMRKHAGKSKIQSLSVKAVYEELKDLHGIIAIRKALAELETYGYLKLITRKAPNPFEYTLTRKSFATPPHNNNNNIITTTTTITQAS